MALFKYFPGFLRFRLALPSFFELALEDSHILNRKAIAGLSGSLNLPLPFGPAAILALGDTSES